MMLSPRFMKRNTASDVHMHTTVDLAPSWARRLSGCMRMQPPRRPPFWPLLLQSIGIPQQRCSLLHQLHSITCPPLVANLLLSIIPPGPCPPPPPAGPVLPLVLQCPGKSFPLSMHATGTGLTLRSKRACADKQGVVSSPLTSALVTAGAAAGSASWGMPRPHTYVMTVRMISTILQRTHTHQAFPGSRMAHTAGSCMHVLRPCAC